MKNRLIITVSDVHGTRAFNVHQIAKKLIVAIVLFVLIVIGGGFWVINNLNEKMDSLRIEKEKEIQFKEKEIEFKEKEIVSLSDKEKKLQAQNQFYSMQIKGKVQDIEELSSKLDDIEQMIGLKNEEDKKEVITEETLATITEKMKMYMLTTIPNGAPLESTKVTSNYGYRIHPISKKRKYHRGIDLKAKRKTPLYAPADGVVSFVQSKNRGDFGRLIKIQHNFGFETLYAHLNKTNVKVGDIVRKNQIIGLTGNSGRSTAPHLHYELRYGSKLLNPKDFIKWQLGNYNSILKKQRRVPWESLVKLINEQHKMVQQ
jgi:murein DD-endopeptidase MepM/ murein hydrolase activator NlpD